MGEGILREEWRLVSWEMRNHIRKGMRDILGEEWRSWVRRETRDWDRRELGVVLGEEWDIASDEEWEVVSEENLDKTNILFFQPEDPVEGLEVMKTDDFLFEMKFSLSGGKSFFPNWCNR